MKSLYFIGVGVNLRQYYKVLSRTFSFHKNYFTLIVVYIYRQQLPRLSITNILCLPIPFKRCFNKTILISLFIFSGAV